MSNDLVLAGAATLFATTVTATMKRAFYVTLTLFSVGVLLVLSGSASALPHGTSAFELLSSGGMTISFAMNPSAGWLVMWGLTPVLLACVTLPKNGISRGWLAAGALAVLGAIGVAGLQDGISFLISWEIMSLSGSYLLLNDRSAKIAVAGQANLFMLSLLEVGSVSLLLGMLVLGARDPSFLFWQESWLHLSTFAGVGLGILFLVGFGAKLGILPFYEWFPPAYSSGSGASGSILSGIVLNVTWFSLGRALLDWMPASKTPIEFGVLVLSAGVISAILSILYGFQQNDWRKLLSFSTAENAGLATAALGAAIMFRSAGLSNLSTLAWIVGLLHLGGHSLAKGALMLTAEHIHDTSGTYEISQHDALSRAPWTLGVGAVLGGMSLSAMPPMAGFVSEWFLFQTVFQGFRLANSVGRVALALGGAGIALIAAISLATMVKVLGVGMLGKRRPVPNYHVEMPRNQQVRAYSILGLGVLALIYAAGMTWLINSLSDASWAHSPQTVKHMADGVLLIPLSSGFAFISPILLVIVGALLAIIPMSLIRLRRGGISGYRRVPIWAQGLKNVPAESGTTPLVFSNAMRQFYSFVYRSKTVVSSDANDKGYFIKQLNFEYSEAPIFGPLLFLPIIRAIRWAADKTSKIQMGSMNLYLLYIGFILLLILMIGILW
ncbi:MAG: hydrogenase [Actinomycetota bacterium]|nr:MAG: hydrogenase [Actinomycetota bacterium]